MTRRSGKGGGKVRTQGDGKPGGGHLSACLACGSTCCTYFCLEIDTPRSKRDFEDIKWYVCHKNAKVYRDDGVWHLLVENRCRFLRIDGRCSNYDHRPALCREYDPDNCEGTGDFDYDVMFENPEDVDRFMVQRFKRGAKRRTPAKTRRYRPPRQQDQEE